MVLTPQDARTPSASPATGCRAILSRREPAAGQHGELRNLREPSRHGAPTPDGRDTARLCATAVREHASPVA